MLPALFKDRVHHKGDLPLAGSSREGEVLAASAMVADRAQLLDEMEHEQRRVSDLDDWIVDSRCCCSGRGGGSVVHVHVRRVR